MEKIKQYILRKLGISSLRVKYKDLVKENQKRDRQLKEALMQLEALQNEINECKQKNVKLENSLTKLQYQIYKYMPEDKYQEALEDWYYMKTGKALDFQNPRKLNEIIQWTKICDISEEKKQLADKYLVRDWVKSKIGEDYLIPLIGVWDSADDIDFSMLPEKFVLKCNHGCGYNIIVTDKSSIDEKAIRKQLNDWLHENFAFKNGFELQYSNIERKVIAEQFIENADEDIYDYKVFCFNGKANFIEFISNRRKGLKKQFFDLNWNVQPFTNGKSILIEDPLVEQPDNLQELIDRAEILAKGFNQVRVDFYRLNDGSWKFGEMTFTSSSGIANWIPEKYDEILGKRIVVGKD